MLNAITTYTKLLSNVYIKALIDEKQIIFVLQTEFKCVSKVIETTVSRMNSKCQKQGSNRI